MSRNSGSQSGNQRQTMRMSRSSVTIRSVPQGSTPGGLACGDSVEVYSRSQRKWLVAEVIEFPAKSKIRVMYDIDNHSCAKTLDWPTQELRCSQHSRDIPSRCAPPKATEPPLPRGSSSRTRATSVSRRSSGEGSSSICSFLEDVNLFKALPKSELARLAAACDTASFHEGEVLIRQGDAGNEFFVIVNGSVSVSADGARVATLESGDHFGENALLQDEPRGATITAETQVSALVMSRDKFDELELRDKLDFPRRQAVGGGMHRPLLTRPPSAKTFEERELMLSAIKDNSNLQSMMTLDDERCNKMIDVAWKEHVPAGKELIKEGDPDADYFYIVQEGIFNVRVKTAEVEVQGIRSSMRRTSLGNDVTMIPKGGSFGELALLYLAPRAATVTAMADSTVWVIDRVNFKHILTKPLEDKAVRYLSYLDGMEALSRFTPDQKMEFAKALREVYFHKGAEIVTQGQRGETLYILVDGMVSVFKNDEHVGDFTGTPENAHIFGERALLGKGVRSATVIVTSEAAHLLAIDKSSTDFLFKSLDSCSSSQLRRSRGDQKIHRDDLVSLGLLGCGGFGAVELVEHRATKAMFALKGLSKGYVMRRGDQKTVMSEKNIQLMCDSPFVVKLFETYNSPQNLYFLLELALGGDLFGVYSKRHVLYGNPSAARFYVAGTVFAFEHLHMKKIVHRDLKPENLLVSEQGHVKLTDMGLAKVVVGKTYTTCGTSEYFAPEVISSVGHNCAVDWWTLGILTFELMYGKTPFNSIESTSPTDIYGKIRKGINRIRFPRQLKGQCEDFVKSLCNHEPSERLPMKEGGAENIKEHAWFQGFDWHSMENLDLDPPYKPTVKSSKEIANFVGKLPPSIRYEEDGSGWDNDFATST